MFHNGSSKVRRASHAGSWYTEKGSQLNEQLTAWLNAAAPAHYPARAIIAPHAGYSYCGECGGHAYKQINPKTVQRVFILGPSHHFHLKGCALTATDRYRTPLYDLTIDRAMCDELMASGQFDVMDIETDENEHSIEMQLPYIAKVMESKRDEFTIVPVLVGSLSKDKEALYGQVFSKYLADPHNLFVISSDFCHWGKRFNYTHYDDRDGHIYQSIEALDRMGMKHIESLDPRAFAAYLKQYQNTICGRHPIAVLLNAIDQFKVQPAGGAAASATGDSRKPLSPPKPVLKFVRYAQSSQCMTAADSSVSYASASLVLE